MLVPAAAHLAASPLSLYAALLADPDRRARRGELHIMKLFIKAIAFSAIAALAACGGSDAGDNIEAAADNQAEALESEAANISEAAEEATGNAAESLENQAAALENQAEATRAAGDNAADNATGNGQ
jgi:hypothetical protein